MVGLAGVLLLGHQCRLCVCLFGVFPPHHHNISSAPPRYANLGVSVVHVRPLYRLGHHVWFLRLEQRVLFHEVDLQRNACGLKLFLQEVVVVSTFFSVSSRRLNEETKADRFIDSNSDPLFSLVSFMG